MAYTTVDNPELFFQTKTYTGDQTANRLITLDGSENMQPDWVWIKNRETSVSHDLYDSVRGVTKYIMTASSSAEATNADGLVGFNTNGFTVDTSWGNAYSGDELVAWCWKAGTSFSNDASSTGVGSLDSSGSVSTDAGFSICSYTGTGGTETIKHGLSSKPAIILVKKRNGSANWYMYHHKNTSEPETDFLTLNSTAATADNANNWNDTEPTSSVFSVGASGTTNPSSGTMIAYCFSEIKGYSKCGSYTGNGNADGTFVYTGFRPAFVLQKKTSGTSDWVIYDNKRDPSNVVTQELKANSNAVESSFTNIDILSNGFKQRADYAYTNNSGGTYIYLAFAEAPFTNSNGIPNNAR